MSIQLNFTICQSENCNSLEFCETTCTYNPSAPFDCCDGYGYATNPSRYDVARTNFFVELPDGTCVNRDIGYVPSVSARKGIQITGGTTGGVIITVGGVVLATALFTVSIQALVADIVSQINSGVTTPDYYAVQTANDTFFIYAVETGSSSNGRQVSVLPDATSDITFAFTTSGDTLEDGAGTDCIEITLDLLFNNCSNPEYKNLFLDGVYTIVYSIFDQNDSEIGRVKKRVFLDCQTRNCLKELILLSLSRKCNCDPSKLQDRITLIRSRLEAAKWEFEDGAYDCANDTLMDACDRCRDACLDC